VQIAGRQIGVLQDESNKAGTFAKTLEPLLAARSFGPVGAPELSPALQRWVKCKKESSPKGATEFSGL